MSEPENQQPDYDDYDWVGERTCSFPCEICGESWDDIGDDDVEEEDDDTSSD